MSSANVIDISNRRTALHIGTDLALPVEVVTEVLGFLGRRGQGKSSAAQKLAEEMHRIGAQFVAFDPVGIWWGLRLATDGKTPGIRVPVFGGLHGDIALESTAGRLIADLIVDRNISAVLDVSQFPSDAAKARFAADFADQFFFRKKASPSAVHVFIEEAQEFVPQNPQRGEETQMLHYFTRMAKIGRNFGIGMSLVSLRPQEVNKKVLNLTEVLFVFQLTGPQERKTVEGWISEKGIDEDIHAILPKLRPRHPHVWSPGLLNESRVVEIADKTTYDASSTPKVGARAAETRNLSPIDIAALSEAMAATIEHAKENDPKELKKQIVALRKQVATAQPTSGEATATAKAEIAQLRADHREKDETIRSLNARIGRVAKAFARLTESLAQIGADLEQPVHASSAADRQPSPRLRERREAPAKREASPRLQSAAATGGLSGPEQRIVDAIAWLNSIGVKEPEQTAVAFIAGYTIGGGAFNNPRGALRTKGLVEYRNGERITLTDDGRAVANWPDETLTAEELQRRVLERLPRPEQRILRVLIDAYPDAIDNDSLARQAGYEPGGGAFNNPRGRLRSLGLVEYPEKGRVVARPLLFLE